MRLIKTRRAQRARSVALLCGVSALAWLIYTAIRSQILLANGRAIAASSANFPRDTFVGEAGAPALTYLALGDSTAAGWGAATPDATYPRQIARHLAARGFRVRLVNAAVGGATVRDVLASQIQAIERWQPDVITLSVGANDATHFTAPADYQRDWGTILAALQASQARTILVADTPDMFLAPALPLPLSWATARRARAQNHILRALTPNSRVQIVPLYHRGKLNQSQLYAADRFHPSAAGYAIWSSLFIEKLSFSSRL